MLAGSVHLQLHERTLRTCGAGEVVGALELFEGVASLQVRGGDAGVLAVLPASRVGELARAEGVAVLNVLQALGAKAVGVTMGRDLGGRTSADERQRRNTAPASHEMEVFYRPP